MNLIRHFVNSLTHQLIIAFLLLSLHGMAQTGTWRAYPAYNDLQQVEQAGKLLYVRASGALYSYNRSDQRVQTFDKSRGLSDCDIAHISYNTAARRLVIVYTNQNIDLLDNQENVTNLSAYHTATVTGDKTVYSLYTHGEYTYFCTGFGIVKLNARKAEISETYNLGFRVDYCYIEGSRFYAASSTNGLYSATLTANLLDKTNWKRTGEYTPRPQNIDPQLLNEVQKLRPGGPRYNKFHHLAWANGRLYATGGGFNYLTDDGTPGMVQQMEGDSEGWLLFDEHVKEKSGLSFVASEAVTVDPTDTARVAVGARSGLFIFEHGMLKSAFNSTNSELSTGVAPDYTIISGLTFDSRGSLWLLNSYSPDRNIIEIKPTGEWVSHFQQGLMEGNQSFLFMRSAFFDTRGRLWFVNSHWGLPALICYEPATDKLKVIRNFVNQDGATLTVTHVRGVTEDREGNLWISTNIGPLALGIEETGKESPVFTQVKVPRNDGSNLADYLLSGVDITCMAIDGANRKWMGTNGSGVYLIGSDNIQEVRHFTRANSPLLSDNVESLAIDGKTGRLFIATDKGLCSYVTDATDPADEMLSDNVYAYPNPVRPDYTGPITITGLSYDADVKIVTVDGTLVHQGRSLGGSYTWDGRDRQGRRVAGGVYSVLTATHDGRKGTVCKIAIVR